MINNIKNQDFPKSSFRRNKISRKLKREILASVKFYKLFNKIVPFLDTENFIRRGRKLKVFKLLTDEEKQNLALR